MWRPLLLVPTLVLIMACADDAPPVVPAGDIGGDWALVAGSVDGRLIPVLPDRRVTLLVEPGRIGGSSACNDYEAELQPGGGFRIGLLSSTAMLCEPRIMEVEDGYREALGKVREARLVNAQLVLAGPGVELVFARLVPLDTSAFADRSWRLVEVVQGGISRPPLGPHAGFELHTDGTFSGSTGCRELTGRFLVIADEIEMVELRAHGPDCPRELADQDGHIVGVIGDGFRVSLAGDRLTVFDSAGEALVYEPDAGTG